MPTWNADQYLKFADERTQPCRDLVARIGVAAPDTAIDLGCGPGNSTAVLRGRWPSAKLVGLDSSPEMITAARAAYPDQQWVVGDIARWAEDGDPFDVVFSNAALQWVGDHSVLYPRIMSRVAKGGAFAMQVPGNYDAPAHEAARTLARSPRWREHFSGDGVREWHVHDLPFYYDTLAPNAVRVDAWETEYLHVFDSPDRIVEWYKGTGLRPFLDALPSDAERARFTSEYGEQIAVMNPARRNGKVLFPFRRLFVVAYR